MLVAIIIYALRGITKGPPANCSSALQPQFDPFDPVPELRAILLKCSSCRYVALSLFVWSVPYLTSLSVGLP